jgi:hypothetical protein
MCVYVDIDVHRKRSQVAVVAEDGTVELNKNVVNGFRADAVSGQRLAPCARNPPGPVYVLGGVARKPAAGNG